MNNKILIKVIHKLRLLKNFSILTCINVFFDLTSI